MANEYPVEASTTIKSPIDWAKVNPVGAQDTSQGGHPLIQASREGMMKGTEDLARSLEERFAQPNWLKVSAAFAKPQLGGFGASFGSAMNELGAQEEARRSIAPTVARMKAEVAAGQYGQSQRIVQQEKYNALRSQKPDPKTWTESEVQSVYQYDPTSPIAEAIIKETGLSSTRAGTRSTDVGTSITGQKAAAENPFLVLKDPMFTGTVAEPSPDQVTGYMAKLDAARPKDVQPEQWAGMSISQKQDAVARYAAETTASGMNEEQKSSMAARASDNLLNDLTYLRTMAVDPKLAPMFSLFKNGDAISMFRSFLDKNPGNTQAAVEGLTAAAMDQLKNADEQTRAKADKFIKGLARLEVNLRGSNVNPTDAFQQLNSMQSPNLGNSQSGFVGILDQMGLQAKHDIDRHNLRVESNVPARRMLTSPEARALENQYRDEAADLARANALKALPSWYKPSASPAAARNKERSEAAGAMPAAGPTGGSMTERLRAEAERRAQQQPRP